MKVFSCTGGGARGIAVVGALHQGEVQGKFNPTSFDAHMGDSFGALIAALTAAGWPTVAMRTLFLNTEFDKLLSPVPWGMRLPMVVLKQVHLDRVARFIDDLRLPVRDNLFINSWDAQDNVQTIFCEKKPVWAAENPAVKTVWVENAFSDTKNHGYGRVITRSMALPGLVADDDRWMDGGLGEHPPLSFIPTDADILMINLGFAGLVGGAAGIPKGILDRGLYAYEVAASIRQQYAMECFPKMQVINLKIYDVSSTAFSMSTEEKCNAMIRAFDNTRDQWSALP